MKSKKLAKKIERTEDYLANTFNLASMINSTLINNGVLEENLKKKQYCKQLELAANEDDSLDEVIFQLGLRLMWSMYQVDQLGIEHIEFGNGCCGYCEEE